MRKPELSLLDWINLILIIIGLVLLARKLLLPQSILPFGPIAFVEEPLAVLLAIGAISELVALMFKSRAAKIFTLFLLALTMIPLLAVTPSVAMRVIAHSQGERYEVQGTLNLINLDKLEVVYEAKPNILYKYSFATSRSPTHCPEITGLAAREDTSREVTIGEVKPPKSGSIYFAACVLELDENWKHEVVGSVEKTPEGYIIRAIGKTEKVFDVIAFLEHNILVPILVSVLSTLVTVYIAHKKGWKV